MYYIVKKENEEEYSLLRIEDTTDATYDSVKAMTVDIKGQFGRLDYAEIWCDFHNNKITREQLRSKLNI